MRKAKEIETELRNCNSFFRTLKLLRECAENYRKTSDSYQESVLYSSILEHYHCKNINNGTGRYVIAL